MHFIFDEFKKYQKSSLDEVWYDDIFWCVFTLLMRRQAVEYGDIPPDEVSRKLAAEINGMDKTYRSFEVAILYELTTWLRDHHYRWSCSQDMDKSILLFLLDITDKKPDLQGRNVWDEEGPCFEITVQGEAFDKLEELFEDHWFALLWKQYFEIDRKCSNVAKYGYIIFIKEGDDNDV